MVRRPKPNTLEYDLLYNGILHKTYVHDDPDSELFGVYTVYGIGYDVNDTQLFVRYHKPLKTNISEHGRKNYQKGWITLCCNLDDRRANEEEIKTGVPAVNLNAFSKDRILEVCVQRH